MQPRGSGCDRLLLLNDWKTREEGEGEGGGFTGYIYEQMGKEQEWMAGEDWQEKQW